MRKLAATVLRRLGTLRHVLRQFLERGFPRDAPRVETVLLIGAAQILFLDVPDHAAVDLGVRLAQADRRAARYPGLVNAVLRRVDARGRRRCSPSSTRRRSTRRDWLCARWRAHYGDETARAIAPPHGHEPPLDLTVKADAGQAGRRACAAACCRPARVRTAPTARSRCCPAIAEGAWWVQDAAAALPARLLGDVARQDASPTCARRPAARPRSLRRRRAA